MHKGAFDIVIGNPPYIRQEDIPNKHTILNEFKDFVCHSKHYKFANSSADIYTYFYAKGLNLLQNGGFLSFITSNKWCRGGYWKNLRELLLDFCIDSHYDFNGVKIFKTATVDTAITTIYATPTQSEHIFPHFLFKREYQISSSLMIFFKENAQDCPQKFLNKENFAFNDEETQALKDKIEAIGTPLKDWDININYGIKTGCNDVKVNGKKEGVFLITSEKRAEILSICDNSKNSLKPYLAFEYNEKLAETKRDLEYKNDFLMINEKERTEQIIKPILRGQDIKRYNYAWANLWLICTRNSYIITKEEAKIFGLKIKDFKTRKRNDIDCVEIPPIDIEEYPALQAHFDEVANKGESKGKGFYNRDDKGITPYNLRNCAYINEFAKPKIVWNPVSGEYFFAYSKETMYFNNSLFMITDKQYKENFLLYILGLMNSTLYKFLITQMTNLIETGKYAYGAKEKIEKLPIPKITQEQERAFVNIVEQIIESKAQNAPTNTLESKLDSMVYALYGLNDREIELISTTPPPHEITIALLLIASVESRLLALVTMLCESFELTLKEAFRFCDGLKIPSYRYESKIIYPETTQGVNFMLDKMGYFLDKTAFMIKGENLEYLNAVLASKMSFWYLKQICSTLQADGLSMSKIFVEKLPVIETHKIDSTLLKEIESLASEILESKRQKTQELEQRLDSLIYQLYGLNQNEINIIESELQSRERERERE